MKKHELLTKAMRDYPAGTVARFKSAPTVDHISNGVFSFCDFNKDGKLHIICGSGINCVYSDGEWAVPVKPSILSGKCAIAVNNEREFKLLMSHMDSKGWSHFTMDKPHKLVDFKYGSTFVYSDRWFSIKDDAIGYTIIPFADFAAEVGIEVPKVLYHTMDEVPVYNKDVIFIVHTSAGRPIDFNNCEIEEKVIEIGTGQLHENHYKDSKGVYYWAKFSTKEAAESFIAEHNKPKEIKIQVEHDQQIIVRKEGFEHKENGSYIYQMKGSMIEQVYNEWKSLQS